MDNCQCPTPFTEDDLICVACETLDQDIYERVHAGLLSTGEAYDDYARRQG